MSEKSDTLETLETAALGAAIEWRRHERHCPICATYSMPCKDGARLMRAKLDSAYALRRAISSTPV